MKKLALLLLILAPILVIAAVIRPGGDGSGGGGGLSVVLSSNAIHVAKSGSDASGNGTLGAPYLTVSNGVRRALSSGATTVYIWPGTYTGTTNGLVVSNATLSIVGMGRGATILNGQEPYASGFIRVAGTGTLHLAGVTVQGAVQDAVQNFGGTLVVEDSLLHANTQTVLTEGHNSPARTYIYGSEIRAHSDGLVAYGETFNAEVYIYNCFVNMFPTNNGTFAHGLYTLDTEARIRMFGGQINMGHTNAVMTEYYAAFNLNDGRIEMHGVGINHTNVANVKHIGNSAGGTVIVNSTYYDDTLVDGSVTRFEQPFGAGAGGPTTSNNIPAGVTVFGTAPATNVLINAASGTLFRYVLTNSVGLLITNGVNGQEIIVELYQDATGNRTVTHVNNSTGAATNFWAFGTDITSPITLTTNANKVDRLKLIYNTGFAGAVHTTNRWDVIGLVRGYPQ